MSSLPLLELDRATVVRGHTRALDEVSLKLHAGEHAAVVGPNGSGKSTLVQLLTGSLYPLARPEGSPPIRVFGRDRWNLNELRGRIGVISADLHDRFVGGSSLGRATALDAVLGSFFASDVLFFHHEVKGEMRESARAALDRLGVGHLANAGMHEISTGEARRVLVARALVHEPEVLVLDEPTAGLDVVAQYDLLARLRSVAAAGTTLVLITHHLEEVFPETRRVILLQSGRIVGDGPPETVLTSPLISRAYGAALDVHRAGGRYSIAVASNDIANQPPNRIAE